MELQCGYLADHPELLDVVAQWAHVEWFAAEGSSRAEALDAYRARCQRDQLPLTLLAWEADRVVGMVSLIYDYGPDDDTELPCLGGLYVVPEQRKRGIGRQLCASVVAAAARLGLRRLTLFTQDHAEFYARLGWGNQRIVHAEIAGEWRPLHMLELAIEPTPQQS